MDANQPYVDDRGRLMFKGHEINSCCWERVDWGHADCVYDGFVHIPLDRKTVQREPLPVNTDWKNSG